MGKADKFIQRQQEMMQRSQVMHPLKNRPIDRNWLSLTDTQSAYEGQLKLASDLIRKKNHK